MCFIITAALSYPIRMINQRNKFIPTTQNLGGIFMETLGNEILARSNGLSNFRSYLSKPAANGNIYESVNLYNRWKKGNFGGWNSMINNFVGLNSVGDDHTISKDVGSNMDLNSLSGFVNPLNDLQRMIVLRASLK